MDDFSVIKTMQDNGIIKKQSRPFYPPKSDAILPRNTPRLQRCCMNIIHQQARNPVTPEYRNPAASLNLKNKEEKQMKTRGFYIGTALMLIISFCAIMPAQAAGPAGQSAFMRGNATSWNAFESLSDEINTLSQAGYDVTSLQASLDAAQSAANAGDAETARTTILALRTQVREAMQSGILSEEQLLQHRETVKNRIQNAVANGNGSQAQLRQNQQTVCAQGQNATLCGNGSPVQLRQNRQTINAQGQNAADCGNGSQGQSKQRRQSMNA